MQGKKPLLFDSHCHLSLLGEVPRIVEALDRARDAGVGFMVDISVQLEDFLERRDLIDGVLRGREVDLFAAEGIAPFYCDRRRRGDMEELASHLTAWDRVRALGEIGLDYFHGYGTRERQEELFAEQLVLAARLDLPVIIHNRDADEDVLRILSEKAPPRRGIIHCFSSDAPAAKKFLDLGFLLSFAGNITYRRSEQIREALLYVPDDALLIETDAPYLSPQSRRGKPNEPAHLLETADFIASLRKCSLSHVARVTRENGLRLLGIPRDGSPHAP